MDIPMTATLSAKIMAFIRRHEGLNLRMDVDTVGRHSVGYGRNMDDVGLRNVAEAEMLAINDTHYFFDWLSRTYPWFHDLDENRQAALVDMCFMGCGHFATFVHMISALADKDYQAAAYYALESKWADQVGQRAKDIANVIRTGEYPVEVKLESL